MCFDPEFFSEDVSLFYDKEQNLLHDENGAPVLDVFSLISPNILYLFKSKKENMIVTGVNGQQVELFYPLSDGDYYF